MPRSQHRVWTVAVIGCGIGRGHIEGYKAHPDKFRVIALCDVDEGRLTAIGDEFAIARRTTSFDEILRIEDIDIVDICTPPALHVTQTLAALAVGKFSQHSCRCSPELLGASISVLLPDKP